VAIGYLAGQANQGSGSVSIGYQSGQTLQRNNTVAIGTEAGQGTQGSGSVAIGFRAGQTSQASNSVVISALGSVVTGATANATYIAPIRNVTNSNILSYNTGTNEITYYNKTFVIDHPLNKDKYLVHACLEGPEVGVYYRGRDEIIEDECEINLPEYVCKFSNELTVQLTLLFEGKFVQLGSSEIKNNKFKVYSNNGSCKFYWHVYGKRCSIDSEPYKSNVKLRGDGPYKWLE